jgi:Ca2+/Na+ antiporter
MKALSGKRKIRILFYIGFVIIIYVATVYGRDWYHISLAILYLACLMVYLAIYLKEKGEKECPRCAKRVKGEEKICRFCYHEFPYQLSLEEKRAENLRVKFNELSEKCLASKNLFEKGEARKKRIFRRGLRPLILFIAI